MCQVQNDNNFLCIVSCWLLLTTTQHSPFYFPYFFLLLLKFPHKLCVSAINLILGDLTSENTMEKAKRRKHFLTVKKLVENIKWNLFYLAKHQMYFIVIKFVGEKKKKNLDYFSPRILFFTSIISFCVYGGGKIRRREILKYLRENFYTDSGWK